MATRILVVDDSPTIRGVVSTILARHGYEPKLAADGQEALDVLSSGAVKVDLVLVDFVMPRMNGYQLCRALRERADLATLPVVLMSAKGDRIREQFVHQTGALDAITKPFDAQALVAVIENALRRVNTSRVSTVRLPEFEDVTSAESSFVEVETRRTNVAQLVGQRLAELASSVLTRRPELSGTKELATELQRELSNDAIVEMFEAIDAANRSSRSGPPLAGDLAAVPIGAVLQLLQSESMTGVLVCMNGGARIQATFRAGAIDLVQSTGAGDEFRLGRYFVEEGILTAPEIDAITKHVATGVEIDAPRSAVQVREAPRDAAPDTVRWGGPPHIETDDALGATTMPGPVLDLALAAAARRSPPLGMALLAAGKIDAAELRAALTRQSSELLYEVIRWSSGRFELRREPPSELAESAKLAMPVASVVMEGFRRVDEWRALERTLGSFDAVLVRDDTALGAFDVASLPAREKAVLDVVDGERSVRAIVAASNVSSFDACRILVQLIEARVLRRRPG